MTKITNMENPKPFLNKKVIIEKEFLGKGDWGSLRLAERWLHENGYSYGSLDGSNPVAVVKGKYDFTQKWHNFSRDDKALVDGVMIGKNRGFRDDVVIVKIFR